MLHNCEYAINGDRTANMLFVIFVYQYPGLHFFGALPPFSACAPIFEPSFGGTWYLVLVCIPGTTVRNSTSNFKRNLKPS